jgi:hypothetical protein
MVDNHFFILTWAYKNMVNNPKTNSGIVTLPNDWMEDDPYCVFNQVLKLLKINTTDYTILFYHHEVIKRRQANSEPSSAVSSPLSAGDSR